MFLRPPSSSRPLFKAMAAVQSRSGAHEWPVAFVTNGGNNLWPLLVVQE